MVTIAVIAMGEMGSGIAGRLVERGARVVTSLDGRSPASVQRAAAAGVESLTDAELVGQTQLLLSIVPPSAALGTAKHYRQIIAGAANKPIFVEMNAIAPRTLQKLVTPFLQHDLRVIDASIVGLPPKPEGYSPRIFMSGPVGDEAEILVSLGLDVQVISDQLGDASAVKMAYAGITKGIQAIATSMAIGVARAGTSAADAFLAEVRDTQPELYAWLSKMLPAMPRKAHRWDDEMLEIAAFLEPERGAADMLTGAAALYRHVAEENVAGPNSEMIAILDRFLGKTG